MCSVSLSSGGVGIENPQQHRAQHFLTEEQWWSLSWLPVPAHSRASANTQLETHPVCLSCKVRIGGVDGNLQAQTGKENSMGLCFSDYSFILCSHWLTSRLIKHDTHLFCGGWGTVKEATFLKHHVLFLGISHTETQKVNHCHTSGHSTEKERDKRHCASGDGEIPVCGVEGMGLSMSYDFLIFNLLTARTNFADWSWVITLERDLFSISFPEN